MAEAGACKLCGKKALLNMSFLGVENLCKSACESISRYWQSSVRLSSPLLSNRKSGPSDQVMSQEAAR